MSLDATRLSSAMKLIFADYDNVSAEDRITKRDELTDRLAAAIVDEMKHVSIIYQAGLVASSTPVTGTFEHTVQ